MLLLGWLAMARMSSAIARCVSSGAFTTRIEPNMRNLETPPETCHSALATISWISSTISPDRLLSGKMVLKSVYRHMLQGIEVSDPGQWTERLDRAIGYAAQQKLPKRPGRSYPREAYTRRAKSTHFQKRKKPDKPNDSAEATSK
jgi:hypothetical protein